MKYYIAADIPYTPADMAAKRRPPYGESDFRGSSASVQTVMQDVINIAQAGHPLLGIEVFEMAPLIYDAIVNKKIPLANTSLLECDFYYLLLIYGPNPNALGIVRDWNGKEIHLNRKESEIIKLQKYAQDWLDNVINKTNHSDPILYEIANEGREQLRELDKNGQFTSINGKPVRSFLYLRIRLSLIIKNKFIYLKVKEIFDYLTLPEITFLIGTFSVSYSYISHIHILSRHYASLLDAYTTKKSYHTMDLPYDQIPSILTVIGNALLNVQSIFLQKNSKSWKMHFLYKKNKYSLYIEKAPANNKNITAPYIIKTLYITQEGKELKFIKDNLREHIIDKDISVYIPTVDPA